VKGIKDFTENGFEFRIVVINFSGCFLCVWKCENGLSIKALRKLDEIQGYSVEHLQVVGLGGWNGGEKGLEDLGAVGEGRRR
jgi:hypothetical protein